MDDPKKKLLEILNLIYEKAKKNDSLKKLLEKAKPLEKYLNKIDVEALKKQSSDLAKKLKDTSGIDVEKLTQQAKTLAAPSQKIPERRMKFPYTFSGKIAHFPYRHYVTHNWIWRYYFISVILCLPLFKYISNLANSSANVKKWKELKKAELHEHH